MQDPFFTRKKRKKGNSLLQADALIDSSLYDFFQSVGRGYQRIEDFFQRFHVQGIKRFFTEIISDGLTFLAIGMVVMVALAQSAFDVTASGEFNPVEDYAVTFLDRYGNEIGRRGIRADNSYELKDLPDFLIKAAIATEDQHFYEHFGIDVAGTLRALLSNAQGDSGLQGGSSITQQLAKNLFLSSERTLERKINEAFLAVWLETHYTKDQILKLYFDRAYMGGGNFGVAAASEYYFGKSVRDIDMAEAAMLAGLFKAPTKYAPHIDLAAARGRANVVLNRMVDAGFYTEGQVTAARRHPAVPVDHTDELESPNYFLDWAFEETKKLVAGTNDIGFVVRTTIDPQLQDYAEQAVTSVIRESGRTFNVEQAALVATDLDGAVRAMVGGVDYGKSQFNRAITPNRQPGSSFKPFVYATAFEQLGYTPQTTIVDGPVCIGNWCPHNYAYSYSGTVTLRNALTRSINTIPVKLSIKTGREPIAEMAHRLGIRNDFPITRSLPLGVASVSPLDMASSYAVFANGGMQATAFGITRITTLRGDVVYEHDRDVAPERLLEDKVAGYINSILRNVVESGTGRRAQVEGVPAAGKTGTTSDYRDAWFVGYTGNYVAAVWMGNDDYHRTNRVTGGSLPATIWQKFMEIAHTNIEVKPLFGVDFTPRPFDAIVVADDGTAGQERPPTLAPQAAQKLLDLSLLFDQARSVGGANIVSASLSQTTEPAVQ
ncbi:MAG: penicillin-binding protein [Hyphomicrobiaceae bacterium]|nr:penicillin-binding protein [Hyphomicrobiaceae bacterium]MCC0023167.1 penicillin-binding protein [Hyphomicrobiaceae bacterium]